LPSWQKEQMSVAYMNAVVAHAGFTVGTWNVDKDGVDMTLRDGGLMVDLQVKCSASPTQNANGDYTYQLDSATYDKLRDINRSAPGYLVLVVVPEQVQHWVTYSPTDLLLACHGYWARLQGRTDAATGATKAVRLPKTQAVSPHALGAMFQDSLSMLRVA
jgi:hypothetical protein